MRPGFNVTPTEFMLQMKPLYLPIVWVDMVRIGSKISADLRKSNESTLSTLPSAEITWACLDLGKQFHFLEIETKLRRKS